VKILSVFGTRPEAIKMAPVVKAIAASSVCEGVTCVTGQHRGLLDQALNMFGITPDFDLNVMSPDQTPRQVCVAVMQAFAPVIAQVQPDLVLVHGDTTTSMAASLTAFFEKVPVGHVEAGLRTGDLGAPWPEEMNRRVTSVATRLHFAPTEAARANLIAETIADDRIWVTGNTVIDALLQTGGQLMADAALSAQFAQQFGLDTHKRLIVVTVHRRETGDDGIDRICAAIRTLAKRSDCYFVVTVHPSPRTTARLHAQLNDIANVRLIAPQAYLPFVYLMHRAHIILTDSGGVQEEAPALGTPVLILRDVSERPEALASSAALVGTDPAKIIAQTTLLLDSPSEYNVRSVPRFPYGDGGAAQAILAVLEDYARSNGP
jgi:UDP-N-acetylglucosamine 2-epimerase (non-hydrolysing)